MEKSVLDLEKEITCAVCHDHYTDPKVLPCCHYYCKQCIHSLALKTGLDKPSTCPECRKPFTLPEGNVNNLPTAFFINRMKVVHSNLEQANGKVEENSTKTDTPATKASIIELLEPLKRSKEGLSQAVEHIENMECELKLKEQSISEDIGEAFEQIYAIIENRKQEMLKEAAMKFSEKLKHLTLQKDNFASSCASIQSAIDYTEQCVERSTDDEVISMAAEIQTRIDREIEEQQKKGKNLEPVEEEEEADIDIEVSFAEDLKQLCQTKAKIVQLPITFTVSGNGIKFAEENKTAEFLVTSKLSNGNPAKRQQVVSGHLKTLASGSVAECRASTVSCGECRVQYTPTVRGHHELTVTVNGQEVKGSPFPVFVSADPTQLGKPVRVISDLDGPNDIAITSDGDLVVSEAYGDVVVLSAEGKRLRSINSSDYNFSVPRGVTVDEKDKIYFIDQSKSEIVKSDKLMRKVSSKETHGMGHYAVKTIGKSVITCERDNNGAIKVYDKKLRCTQVLTPKGVHCGKFVALSSDETGTIFAADLNNECIWVMTRTGELLRSIGYDHQSIGKLTNPIGLCVYGQYVYVSDWGTHHIVVFTLEGEYVTSFGQEGDKEGEFNRPSGLCMDKDGFLYVCDLVNGRIQVF